MTLPPPGPPPRHPEWEPGSSSAPPGSSAPPPARPPKGLRPRIITGVAIAVMIALFALIQPWDAQRRQDYSDQLTVWTTPPTAEIEALAVATGMSETGRRIFFASRPSLEDADAFNANCSFEGATVLGCYDGERIHVFRVTDERLAGTNEVTAAHEMLHAAYDRLSLRQRAEVDALVAAFVEQLELDDPTRRLVEGYPPAQQADEWHSRLGTEYAELPAELEAHYARYFDDRSRVFALNNAANAEFRALRDRIDALVAQIDALGRELDERSARYEADLDAYDAAVEDFNARADDGDFPSQDAFDAERQALLDRQATLDTTRRELNADIERYNSLIEELGSLDASYAELFSKLDSSSDSDGTSPRP